MNKLITLSVASVLSLGAITYLSLTKPIVPVASVAPVTQSTSSSKVSVTSPDEVAVPTDPSLVVTPTSTVLPVEPTPVITPVVTPVTPVVAPVVPAPVILSTQEYAEKYLDFTINYGGPTSQQCLDAIVSKWPERFTPELRENNIKALRMWNAGGICATGILSVRGTGYNLVSPIIIWGVNGEYFDSGAADAQRY